MSTHSSRLSNDSRPEFMITLGLAPPYVMEDVKRAYLERAKQAHPDRGGSPEAFNEIHQAFERAQAYVEFRADRRAWIAARMGRYIAVQDAVTRLQRLGATVTTKAPEWLEHSFGEFAQLNEAALNALALNAANGDEIIAALVAEQAPLRELVSIELPGCRVSDDAVLSLRVFPVLRELDLSRTPVTRRVLEIVDAIPTLETLVLDDTQVGWWARRRTAARLRRRSE